MNKIIAIAFCLFTCFSSSAQIKIFTPDLSKKDNLQAINRQVSLLTDKMGKTIVHLDAKDGAGILWINDLNFKTGVIEFDVKGKDALQRSFVGISWSE